MYSVTVHIVDINWVWCYRIVSAVEQLCPRTGKEKNNYAHVEEKK
jgi:hypothetical protein